MSPPVGGMYSVFVQRTRQSSRHKTQITGRHSSRNHCGNIRGYGRVPLPFRSRSKVVVVWPNRSKCSGSNIYRLNGCRYMLVSEGRIKTSFQDEGNSSRVTVSSFQRSHLSQRKPRYSIASAFVKLRRLRNSQSGKTQRRSISTSSTSRGK